METMLSAICLMNSSFSNPARLCGKVVVVEGDNVPVWGAVGWGEVTYADEKQHACSNPHSSRPLQKLPQRKSDDDVQLRTAVASSRCVAECMVRAAVMMTYSWYSNLSSNPCQGAAPAHC
jgi:hypothetical protein